MGECGIREKDVSETSEKSEKGPPREKLKARNARKVEGGKSERGSQPFPQSFLPCC